MIQSHRHFMNMALPGKLHLLIPRSSILLQFTGYELCHRKSSFQDTNYSCFKLMKFPTICLFFNPGFSSSRLGEENMTRALELARKILS